MTVYQILSLCGLPSILGTALVATFRYMGKLVSQQKALSNLQRVEQSKQMGQVKTEIDIIKVAMQAQLRDKLLQSYKVYMRQGYADYDDKQNWLNQYNSYHNLGTNGIMDSYKDKLLNLPDTPTEQKG